MRGPAELFVSDSEEDDRNPSCIPEMSTKHLPSIV